MTGGPGPRLDVPLILEQSHRTADGMGGFRLSWQPVGQLWAQLRAGAGRERFAQVGAESTVPWRITLRGAPVGDPRRPCPDQRFRMGTRLFRITSVAEGDAQGRYLLCTAFEEKLA